MRPKSIFAGGLLTLVLIAGLAGGAFAIFSDNVASDDQYFTAGSVDITVDDQDEFFETTLDMDNMEAGECSEQTVRVSNVGSLDVDLWNWIYTWGDIFSCDPNPDCNMYVEKTLVGDSDSNPEYIEANIGYEDYELEACLPLCAGNLCQGKDGAMRMFFHAVQWSHLDGWDCVKLLHKEAPDWLPDPTWTPNASGIPAHGNKCYEASSTDGDVDFVVNGYNMTANMPLQIMLNGPGGCSKTDQIIAGDFTGDNVVDAGNYDAYYRGFWTGTAMSNTCSGTGEGVYAIAYGGSYGTDPDPAAVTDANGNFSGQWTAHLADPCVIGDYNMQLKFLVKQDAAPWLEELDELDYQYIEFTCP
jgi:hypothetical protein